MLTGEHLETSRQLKMKISKQPEKIVARKKRAKSESQ
jgi:hypothetical protein